MLFLFQRIMKRAAVALRLFPPKGCRIFWLNSQKLIFGNKFYLIEN